MGIFLFFNLSGDGEKNTLLKTLIVRLVVVVFKSVFFCVESNAACAMVLKRTFLKPCGLLPTPAVMPGVPT